MLEAPLSGEFSGYVNADKWATLFLLYLDILFGSHQMTKESIVETFVYGRNLIDHLTSLWDGYSNHETQRKLREMRAADHYVAYVSALYAFQLGLPVSTKRHLCRRAQRNRDSQRAKNIAAAKAEVDLAIARREAILYKWQKYDEHVTSLHPCKVFGFSSKQVASGNISACTTACLRDPNTGEMHLIAVSV
jgi:hypothetical protein